MMRQRTDFKVRTLHAAGGGCVANALMSRSALGPLIHAMEACMRALPRDGREQAVQMRTALQKLSLCISTGRLSSEEVHAALCEPSIALCEAFVEKAHRIERVRTLREAHALFLRPSRFGSSMRALSRGTPSRHSASATHASSASHATPHTPTPETDPRDPQHARLANTVRRLGEAVAQLLAPSLSARSIGRIDELFDWWGATEVLEAFFTMEVLREERDLMMDAMKAATDE